MKEHRISGPASDCDVVVIGAGAAGLAAGRRLAAAGLSALILEARDRLGGRSWTVPTEVGIPVDLGCEWLHSADRNPWTALARAGGHAVDETLPDWGLRVAAHGGEATQLDWQAARDEFEAAMERAATCDPDRPAATLLPPQGRWNALLDAISTWSNGTELARLSIKDRMRYADSGINWRLPAGYGTLIAGHGAQLPVRLGTIVESLDHGGPRVVAATNRGTLTARAAIVTVATNLLAAETIRFAPALPDKIAAAAALPLGVANKLFLRLAGPAEAFTVDRHLVGVTTAVETGSYQLRPHGWPMIAAYFGGRFAAALEAVGAAAMADFAIGELAGLFGSDIRRRLSPLASSAWVSDRFARGSYSYAQPGHAEDRLRLAAPVGGRLFFAGDACSPEHFSTAHGAFITGIAAAEAAAALLRAPGSDPA